MCLTDDPGDCQQFRVFESQMEGQTVGIWTYDKVWELSNREKQYWMILCRLHQISKYYVCESAVRKRTGLKAKN